jgi:3',5'-cyclic AMP phosphodiesterase CpdA
MDRRRCARLAAAAVTLTLVAPGCVGASAEPAPHASGSTRMSTWVDPDGDGALQVGPGEQIRNRTELAAASRPTDRLAVFAQLTDAHVTDEESPARVEMLDRLGPPFTSPFRPQESLTPFVLAGVVATIDRLHPDAVFETGDLIDNAQQNELELALGVLHGGRVDPDSGAAGYDGVQSAANPDPLIYRPGVDAPRHPGLLDAAQRPFTSPGLDAPWYPIPGNHDLLVQGNLAATPQTNRIAVGSRKVVTLDRDVADAARAGTLTPQIVDRLLAERQESDAVTVPADPGRRELSPAEAIERLRSASGGGGAGPTMDSTVDLGPGARAILLDTARRTRGAGGELRPSQVRWLRSQLAASDDRWVIVFSGTPLTDTAGSAGALALLDGDPRVVAAIAGDVHRNSIEPRRTAAGGYWLITTSSLADYPQQARAFSLWRTAGGGVALETWMLNADPSQTMAATSRELAFLDYQGGRATAAAGSPSDRNAVLFHGPA